MGSGPWVAEYVVRGGRLWAVEVVPASQYRDFNAPRLPWLDLSYARSLRGKMDKTGATHIVRAVKLAWYGDPSERMDREKCDDFFNTDEHFVLEGDDVVPAAGSAT